MNISSMILSYIKFCFRKDLPSAHIKDVSSYINGKKEHKIVIVFSDDSYLLELRKISSSVNVDNIITADSLIKNGGFYESN